MSNIYLDRLRSISGKPPVWELSKPTKGGSIHGMPAVQEPTKPTKGAYVGFVGPHTIRIAENEVSPALRSLLAQHGGFPGINWHGLALIDAEKSALWIVQRPDGRLTTLATVEPIPKPRSYRNAWPARFTTPEPVEDAAPAAAQAAQTAIEKARQSCWDCRHFDTHPRPTCALRHPVAWRLRHASTGRQTPSRTDQLDCGDHTA